MIWRLVLYLCLANLSSLCYACGWVLMVVIAAWCLLFGIWFKGTCGCVFGWFWLGIGLLGWVGYLWCLFIFLLCFAINSVDIVFCFRFCWVFGNLCWV